MLEAIEAPTGRCDDETELGCDDDLGDKVGDWFFPVSPQNENESFSTDCFRRDAAEI